MNDSYIIKSAMKDMLVRYSNLGLNMRVGDNEFTIEELLFEVESESLVGKELCDAIIGTVLTLFVI